MASRIERLMVAASQPVDAASIAVFRMCFGAIAFWEVCRYFQHGWISRYWEEPTFHFHYTGFGWVRALPAPGMQVLWGVLGVAALGIAAGALYRVAAIVFAVGFGYSFLVEAGHYLNHFYLMALLAALLAVIPAHRLWSVDAWARRWPPNLAAPAWSLWLVRFQVGVLYVGGGIAKIDPDWLRGEPLGTWLGMSHPLAGIVAAWSGLVFDLLIVFAVWWRRTRMLGLAIALIFHAINSQIFTIGVFPFLAFTALLIFCPPDWPRLGRRSRPRDAVPDRLPTGWAIVAAVYVAAQILIPLRHLAMPGRAAWTEAGHTFSWHMKLRDKDGAVTFKVVDPTTHELQLVAPETELADWQWSDLAGRPELIRQFAHHLADERTHRGVRPHVYALTSVSLNGREPQELVDPEIDLAAEPATWATPDWLVPLREPLP